jgi:hypothetical protein
MFGLADHSRREKQRTRSTHEIRKTMKMTWHAILTGTQNNAMEGPDLQ